MSIVGCSRLDLTLIIGLCRKTSKINVISKWHFPSHYAKFTVKLFFEILEGLLQIMRHSETWSCNFDSNLECGYSYTTKSKLMQQWALNLPFWLLTLKYEGMGSLMQMVKTQKICIKRRNFGMYANALVGSRIETWLISVKKRNQGIQFQKLSFSWPCGASARSFLKYVALL